MQPSKSRSTAIVPKVPMLGDVLAVAEDVGADDFSRAGRQEVVRHVADDRVGEEPPRAHRRHRAHEHRPADAADADGDEEDRRSPGSATSSRPLRARRRARAGGSRGGRAR